METTASRAPKSSTIRPLTLAERKKPAQLSFYGGFKNVSFQIGEIFVPDAATRNINTNVSNYVKGTIHKGDKTKYPIMIPTSLSFLKGFSNTVAQVIGQKNTQGGYDAVLVARNTERLSSFNAKLRTVEDLLKNEDSKPDEIARMGKSSAARAHNQVMLVGVVVGARFEDGQHPKFHIDLRQDASPNNIIPLIYDAKNASAMINKVKYGSLIYVDGEYAYRQVPVFKMTDEGKVFLDDSSNPVIELDEAGAAKKRIHTYIRITAPKAPADFDTDFGNSFPRWITEIAEEIAQARERSAPTRTSQEALAPSENGAKSIVVAPDNL